MKMLDPETGERINAKLVQYYPQMEKGLVMNVDVYDKLLVQGVMTAIVVMSIAATLSKTFRSIIACIGGNLVLLVLSMLCGFFSMIFSSLIWEGNETIQFIAFIVTTFIAFVSLNHLIHEDWP